MWKLVEERGYGQNMEDGNWMSTVLANFAHFIKTQVEEQAPKSKGRVVYIPPNRPN